MTSPYAGYKIKAWLNNPKPSDYEATFLSKKIMRDFMFVDYGYKPFAEKYIKNYEQAREILQSSEQYSYYEVDCENGGYAFKASATVCPVCSATLTARDTLPPKPVINTDYVIEQFLEPQFDFSNINYSSLKLNHSSFQSSKDFVCPCCSNRIYKSDEKREITLIATDDKAYIKVEIKTIDELINCVFSVCADESVDLLQKAEAGCKEVLTIDAASGKTFLSLEGNNGETYYSYDITGDFDTTKTDACLTLIISNSEIKKFIIEFLSKFWSIDFPFSYRELSLQSVISMNMFKGFSKSFYAAIPFKLGTFVIEESFPVYKSSEEALEALGKSSLPKSKQIKKCIFKNQGMFFYINELERLYKCINNTAIFIKLINMPEIYIVLFYLHTYCIDGFLSDFCSFDDKTIKLPALIYSHTEEILECAKDYSLLNPFYRKKLFESGFEKYIAAIENEYDDYYSRFRINNDFKYSMPMSISISSKYDDCVDKYYFKAVLSTNETYLAGKILNNCLVNWSFGDNNVVIIYNGSSIVGAIELSGYNTNILQAKLSKNASIEEDERVCNAFIKWADKHSLSYMGCMDLWNFCDTDEELCDDYEFPF